MMRNRQSLLPPPYEISRLDLSSFGRTLIAGLIPTLLSLSASASDYVYNGQNPLTRDPLFEASENANSWNANGVSVTGDFTLPESFQIALAENIAGTEFNGNLISFDLTAKDQSLNTLDIFSFESANAISVSENELTLKGTEAHQTGLSNRFHLVHTDNDSQSSQTLISKNIARLEWLEAGGSNSIATVYAGKTGGIISENELHVTNSQVKNVCAVSASAGTTVENSPSIVGNKTVLTGTSFNTAYGAYVSSGASTRGVSGNSLTLKDSTSVSARFGVSEAYAQYLYTSSEAQAVQDGTLTVEGSFSIENSDETHSQSFEMGGGYSLSSNVEENTVVFKDAAITMSGKISSFEVYGGFSKKKDAVGNRVEITNSSLSANNKASKIYGGYASAGQASGNQVSVFGSTVQMDIIGAYAVNSVSGSQVSIEASTIIGTVAVFGGNTKTQSGSGSISVKGDSDLSQAKLLPHNIALTGFRGTADTNLVLDGFSGVVGGLGSVTWDGSKAAAFDHVSMLNQEWARDDAVLTVTGTAAFNRTSLDDRSLSFTDASAVEKGGTITLVEAANGITYVDADGANEKELASTAGTALEFTGTVNYGENAITYTVKGAESADQTILVGDSRLASAAFVNQSTDLLERVFHGFTLWREKYGLMTFATAEGTKSDYDLSSPIKVNGWNFLAGVRSVAPTGAGDLTSALFVEYGEGNYRTKNDHLGMSFRTDGDLQYVGAGAAVRLMTPSLLYVEGSVRAGELKSDLDRALMDANGNFYDADTKSFYGGLHLGAGFIAKPAAGMEVDSYAKYFFTYTDSDSFKISSLNETYEFESITSHRLRLGTRASWNVDNVVFMLGLAGEYEFDGESDMIAANAPARTSDLGGFSAFAEAGLSMRPSAASPWQFDAQIRGWEGKRDAVSGMATVNYLF